MYGSTVYVNRCEEYDERLIAEKMREALSCLGVGRDMIEGRRVLLKLNLVLAKSPDHAATTHPAFVRAAAEVFHGLGAKSVIAADSPGRPFSAQSVTPVYKACGIEASDILSLNDDFTFGSVKLNGVKLKNLHVINAFESCDVIVDLCKLKTHSLTQMSCATKNLFGLIPGVEKFEMHSTFPYIEDFSEMLVDLNEYVLSRKRFIALCDAIVGMEGNGPSYGTPKKAGLILASLSPFALDVAAEHIIGMDGYTVHLDRAAKRGCCVRSCNELDIVGLDTLPVIEFKKPDTSSSLLKKLPDMFGGRLVSFFEVKPRVSRRKCVGCGVCARSCPRHTIEIKEKRGKKTAVINRDGCIKCYCCAELCPIGAVDAKQNALIKLIH